MSSRKNNSGGGFLIGLLHFMVGVAGALLSGLTALIVWLSSWLGVTMAALVVSLLFMLIALLSYALSLHGTIKRIGKQFETVSYVADLIESGYDWVRGKTALALRVVEQLLDRLVPPTT